MDNINRDIEKYWREYFSEQIEQYLYQPIPQDTPEKRWFDEGMRHAILLLRYMRTDE